MSIIAARRSGSSTPPPENVVVSDTTTGTNTSGGTTATVTLPVYSSGDYLLLIVARNQTSTAWVGDSNASIVEVANSGTRRLSFIKVNPTGTPTSFVLTASITGVWSWCCMNLGAITPTIVSNSSDIGTNATSTIAVPTIVGVSITDGHELQVIAGATNSTATWTTASTPNGQTVRCNITTAPGLLVTTAACSSGQTSFSTSDIDRGNNGTSRNEQALVSVFA
jgi:hypothetical protein